MIFVLISAKKLFSNDTLEPIHTLTGSHELNIASSVESLKKLESLLSQGLQRSLVYLIRRFDTLIFNIMKREKAEFSVKVRQGQWRRNKMPDYLWPKRTFFPPYIFSAFYSAPLKWKLASFLNTFSRSSLLSSNSSLLLVPGREESPMMSFDAETDLNPIIINISQIKLTYYKLKLLLKLLLCVFSISKPVPL